jgi:hypothetical protein
MKRILALMLLLLAVPAALFAQDGDAIDFGNATSVITWLMPVITLGVTWLVKKIAPFVTGTITLIAVPLVSTGIAYLSTLISEDSSFWLNAAVGLGSVFLNQLYRSLTAPPVE